MANPQRALARRLVAGLVSRARERLERLAEVASVLPFGTSVSSVSLHDVSLLTQRTRLPDPAIV